MSTTDTTAAVAVNPNPGARRLGADQGQLRHGSRVLTVSGQGPLDASGRLLHEDDLPAQLALALENVAAVVAAAGMTMADVAQLRVHVTDLAAALDSYGAITEFLADHGASPPTTLVEVARLALAGMAVEIDALAIA